MITPEDILGKKYSVVKKYSNHLVITKLDGRRMAITMQLRPAHTIYVWVLDDIITKAYVK